MPEEKESSTGGEKAIKLKDLGTVIHADDLSMEMLNHGAHARPLFNMKRPTGQRWKVVFIDGLGLAVVSEQTNRVFVLECQTLVQLACEAGVEDEIKTIILPSEVRRG